MKKIIYLTESDLYRISEKIIKEGEIEEGIFDGISNIYQGLKGVWRGEGFEFFKHLSSLKNLAKELKKLDKPNVKIMTKLTELKSKISSSKMPDDKKGQLIYEIDEALKNFNEYSTHIDNLEKVASERLQGTSNFTGNPKSGLTSQPTSTQQTGLTPP
jgi:HEPN domain-containing protein